MIHVAEGRWSGGFIGSGNRPLAHVFFTPIKDQYVEELCTQGICIISF